MKLNQEAILMYLDYWLGRAKDLSDKYKVAQQNNHHQLDCIRSELNYAVRQVGLYTNQVGKA